MDFDIEIIKKNKKGSMKKKLLELTKDDIKSKTKKNNTKVVTLNTKNDNSSKQKEKELTPKKELAKPKIETPKKELAKSKIETPKKELAKPKIETPKKEQAKPKIETPKKELAKPKIETPKIETPKKEQAKPKQKRRLSPKIFIKKLSPPPSPKTSLRKQELQQRQRKQTLKKINIRPNPQNMDNNKQHTLKRQNVNKYMQEQLMKKRNQQFINNNVIRQQQQIPLKQHPKRSPPRKIVRINPIQSQQSQQSQQPQQRQSQQQQRQSQQRQKQQQRQTQQQRQPQQQRQRTRILSPKSRTLIELEKRHSKLKSLKELELKKINAKKQKILDLTRKQEEAQLLKNIEKEQQYINKLVLEQKKLDKLEFLQNQRIKNNIKKIYTKKQQNKPKTNKYVPEQIVEPKKQKKEPEIKKVLIKPTINEDTKTTTKNEITSQGKTKKTQLTTMKSNLKNSNINENKKTRKKVKFNINNNIIHSYSNTIEQNKEETKNVKKITTDKNKNTEKGNIKINNIIKEDEDHKIFNGMKYKRHIEEDKWLCPDDDKYKNMFISCEPIKIRYPHYNLSLKEKILILKNNGIFNNYKFKEKETHLFFNIINYDMFNVIMKKNKI